MLTSGDLYAFLCIMRKFTCLFCLLFVFCLNSFAQNSEMQKKIQRAKNGDIAEMIAVGKAYVYGADGLSIDYTKAREWFTKAANSTSDVIYPKVAKDELERLERIEAEKAAREKEKVQSNTSSLSAKEKQTSVTPGIGNREESESYYKQAISGTKAARKKLEQMVVDGDAYAMLCMGKLYQNGEGVKRDYEKALGLLKMSAEKGCSEAMYILGSMYYNGENGVKKDGTLSLAYFKTAADNGDVASMKCIGDLYYNGFGVNKNEAEAKRWYKKASDNGFAPAKERLAEIEIEKKRQLEQRIAQSVAEQIKYNETTRVQRAEEKRRKIEDDKRKAEEARRKALEAELLARQKAEELAEEKARIELRAKMYKTIPSVLSAAPKQLANRVVFHNWISGLHIDICVDPQERFYLLVEGHPRERGVTILKGKNIYLKIDGSDIQTLTCAYSYLTREGYVGIFPLPKSFISFTKKNEITKIRVDTTEGLHDTANSPNEHYMIYYLSGAIDSLIRELLERRELAKDPTRGF